MTVLANGCERMEPKQLHRKFIETGGDISLKGEDIVVSFYRRSHNPVIAQEKLDRNLPPIPWLKNKRLRFEFK